MKKNKIGVLLILICSLLLSSPSTQCQKENDIKEILKNGLHQTIFDVIFYGKSKNPYIDFGLLTTKGLCFFAAGVATAIPALCISNTYLSTERVSCIPNHSSCLSHPSYLSKLFTKARLRALQLISWTPTILCTCAAAFYGKKAANRLADGLNP